jgi:HK97 family phage major capsid protein
VTPQERLEAIEVELRSIHDAAGDNPLDEAQQKTWDDLTAERSTREGEVRAIEARRTQVATLATRPTHVEQGDGTRSAPNVIIKDDPYEVLQSRGVGMSTGEIRRKLVDGNLRAAEGLIEGVDAQRNFEKIVKRHASDSPWAAGILARSHPDYLSAFSKLVTGRAAFLSEDEKRAAMAVGTNTAGGHLVPTHLDPTLILTSSGTSNVIRGISRVVTLTDGNTWRGVTTAGATASWDSELSEVSDDTPAVAPVSIPLYSGRALVQASIEAMEDISGLTSDVLMILADAKDRLEAVAHATGSGSAPTGIFTALDANTNVEIISATANVIALADLHSVYRQVPVRWRGRSTWLMNPFYSLGIKALGTALSASYTTDATMGTAGTLLGRPVVESDEAPSTQTTTANDNAIVFGDFSNFIIVDKPGSASIELIPHMFNTSNNLPDGRRAWFMHFRSGSDSVNDLGFRLLQEKTSA